MPNTEPANKPFISYKLLHKNRNVSLFLHDGLTIKIAQISRSAKIDDDRDILEQNCCCHVSCSYLGKDMDFLLLFRSFTPYLGDYAVVRTVHVLHLLLGFTTRSSDQRSTSLGRLHLQENESWSKLPMQCILQTNVLKSLKSTLLEEMLLLRRIELSLLWLCHGSNTHW